MLRLPLGIVCGSRKGLLKQRTLAGSFTQTCNVSSFESMYLKVVNLPPVHFIEDSLAQFHDFTGIPWCGTIVVCTAALRLLVTLPAQTTSQKVAAKRHLLKKEMDEEIIPGLKAATKRHIVINKWSPEKAKFHSGRVYSDVWRAKVIEYNCHFSKLFLPLYLQIPVWVCCSVGLRNLSTMRGSDLRLESVPAQERFVQMSAEGMMWFPNLTIPDSSLLLPLLVGCSFAANIFISQRRLKANQIDAKLAKHSRIVNYLIYSLAVVMVPLAALQPAAVAVYWTTSGLSGTVINLLLLSPKFRHFVKIPKTPLDSKTPYIDLKDNFFDIFKSKK